MSVIADESIPIITSVNAGKRPAVRILIFERKSNGCKHGLTTIGRHLHMRVNADVRSRHGAGKRNKWFHLKTEFCLDLVKNK